MNQMRAILIIGMNFLRTQALTVLIMVTYLAGMAAVFLHNQRSQEARFFLQLHSFYVIFIAMVVAVPAVYTERRSRRIVAVLSKGIHRWEYLGGILCGCAMISAIFCALVAGISLALGLRGGYPVGGLGGLMLVLFLCSLMASAIGLFFGTFLHPLLATAAASTTIALPLLFRQAGVRLSGTLFPASWLADSIVNFEFGAAAGAGELTFIAAMAVGMTILFWIASAVVFAHRDVTIAPE